MKNRLAPIFSLRGQSTSSAGAGWLLVMLSGSGASAAPADVDVGFSQAISGISAVQGLVLRADGAVVVTGVDQEGGRQVLFRTDGTRDHAYGDASLSFIPEAIVGYSNGRTVITAVGSVARALTTGRRDPSFGGAGEVSLSLYSYSAAVQTDGKILVAGEESPPVWSQLPRMEVVRFTADGRKDAGFGADGSAFFGDRSSPMRANAVAVQADGKIVAAGGANVVRFLPSGELDTAFGASGRAGVFESASLSWSSARITETLVSEQNGVEQVRATAPLNPAGSGFLRLRVTAP